ncbi:cell envelope integrity protein CreD [Lutibacter sp. TH_r2]|uniref:cell envelope integrity protein CreD n=1 Tax=Lutibacter sp. TH_r2 TaxID=3082083 RepID=UPI002952FC6D|nr:cell envelope integrity protein CreD [Lutibacter sp. TH_r2]MDV7185793.1 cell envelope integrity protein CreD [Lutibacter sp. TH_r2]
METQKNKFGNWLKNSITARMLMVGILIIVLLIPLSYIQSLIVERSSRQESVVNEINQKWGNEVLLYGPILKVPYKTYTEKLLTNSETKKVTKETIEHTNYAYFFPEELNIESEINPEVKQRGIYKTSVYKSSIKLNGSYSKPNFNSIEANDKDILWEKATVIIKTSNLKGINNQVEIALNKHNYSFVPKYEQQDRNIYNKEVSMHKLETSYLDKEGLISKKGQLFSINLTISGSKQFKVIPIGRETDLNVKSNWKTANFIGEFLPLNNDKITDDGFNAKWKVLHINRPFSQEYFKHLPNLKEFAFGVNFMIPVDEYQKSERSAKYGFLVIALTFLVFFLIQSISKIPIHPFQYLMIGLALTMFYTLLISISEHSNFLKAYLIAGISVIGLIVLYSKSILKTFKFPLFIGVSLTALYTFIYVIIQLENYALLVGSIGLFTILALVMYASRKIDWSF